MRVGGVFFNYNEGAFMMCDDFLISFIIYFIHKIVWIIILPEKYFDKNYCFMVFIVQKNNLFD
jgi:hypothetical protein